MEEENNPQFEIKTANIFQHIAGSTLSGYIIGKGICGENGLSLFRQGISKIISRLPENPEDYINEREQFRSLASHVQSLALDYVDTWLEYNQLFGKESTKYSSNELYNIVQGYVVGRIDEMQICDEDSKNIKMGAFSEAEKTLLECIDIEEKGGDMEKGSLPQTLINSAGEYINRWKMYKELFWGREFE